MTTEISFRSERIDRVSWTFRPSSVELHRWFIHSAKCKGLCSFWTYFRSGDLWGTFLWAFINATLTLLTEAKQNSHSALDLGIQSQTASDTHGWDLCTIQLCEMWNCPVDELQSVLLCIFLRNVSGTRGRGSADTSSPVFRTQMAQARSWLCEGEGAAELPVTKDWWSPRRAEDGAGTKGIGTRNRCQVPRARWHVGFSVRPASSNSDKSRNVIFGEARKPIAPRLAAGVSGKQRRLTYKLPPGCVGWRTVP